jgi:hypothetical protein
VKYDVRVNITEKLAEEEVEDLWWDVFLLISATAFAGYSVFAYRSNKRKEDNFEL